MNHELRLEIISKWLIMDLARYERPPNFSEIDVKPEVQLMAGDVNSEISTAYAADGMKELLLRIGQAVRKTHKSRRWPVIAEYITAAKDCQKTRQAPISDHQQSNLDSDIIAAKRINAGDAVAESYIIGTGADRLIAKRLVNLDALAAYRQSLAESKTPQFIPTTNEPNFMENPY
jgi:hypothetical protein